MHTEPGGGAPESATFAQALGTLKRQGSNILLVGEGATAAHDSACRRLLGDTSRDSRYRIFVVTEGSRCSTVHDGDGMGSPETTRIVSRSDRRPHSEESNVPWTVVDSDTLSDLGSTLIEHVDEFEDEVDGFDPSELRICFDSLAPLLADYRTETVFRLFHMVTARVRQGNGMGHYHLPVDRDHDAVRLLEPLFDATVEVRKTGADTEQRWHLRDKRTSSDWISL